ncbi:unnamed protein product [Ostreobium quekettii]|uniref:Endonuclease/exonuclease/phosphatase domain-containing protein n=1 Tax=Ostreobium quekettii TaxID=121088 RepID=A0A8S1J3X4_9CHLO|nr:unnamed protein product [Ostreobium quekettii]
MHPGFRSALVILSALLSFATGELLITQVVEGSLFNKIVVFTNRGTASVDLSDYALWMAKDGGKWRKNLEPLGRKSLGAGESFTLCNPKVVRPIRDHCDVMHDGLTFNGNDSLGLRKGGDTVDLFGDQDGMGLNAKGKAFRIDGEDDASLDHTVVRKEGVKEGNTNWAVSSRSEWEVRPKDDFLVDGGTISLAHSEEGVCQAGTQIHNCSEPTNPGQDRRANKKELVIGTFNPEWLFDGKSDSPHSRWLCYTEGAALHLPGVADIIRRISPDILGLQEVEDCSRLSDLVELLSLGYEGYLVEGEDRATGQDVALLTRVDPSGNLARTAEKVSTPAGSKCGAHDNSTGVSKHLVARFPPLEGIPFKFAIINVHFKAYPKNASSCAQREGQAKVIQNEARRLIDDGYEVAILGDLNDLSDLHRVKTCSKETKPLSRVLSMLRDVDDDGVDDLRNAIEFVPVGERYSSRFIDEEKEKLSLIDHVLLTPKLWGLVDRVWIDHTGADAPYEDRVSDHWPILVALRTDGSPGSGAVINSPPCV